MNTDPKRVINNMIKKYGKAKTRAFIKGLEGCQTSLAELGRDLGVTRERARQLSKALGTKITIYQAHPDVTRALKR